MSSTKAPSPRQDLIQFLKELPAEALPEARAILQAARAKHKLRAPRLKRQKTGKSKV